MVNNYSFLENSLNSSFAFRSLLNATSYPGRSYNTNNLIKPNGCLLYTSDAADE